MNNLDNFNFLGDLIDYCVITFASTHGAIFAQKVLKGISPFQIMPVLREISLGCGMSIRFGPEYLEAVRGVLSASELADGEYAFYGVSGHGAGLIAQPICST